MPIAGLDGHAPKEIAGPALTPNSAKSFGTASLKQIGDARAPARHTFSIESILTPAELARRDGDVPCSYACPDLARGTLG
jgi:hypothetical protein